MPTHPSAAELRMPAVRWVADCVQSNRARTSLPIVVPAVSRVRQGQVDMLCMPPPVETRT